MTWEVLFTDVYESWFLKLSEAEQIDVQAMVDVLEIKGSNLGRPHADTIHGSRKIKNLKELVIQHAGNPYRVFFAFDPKRHAVLLCGGRKDGSKNKQFYKKMILLAESEFDSYLQQERLK